MRRSKSKMIKFKIQKNCTKNKAKTMMNFKTRSKFNLIFYSNCQKS